MNVGTHYRRCHLCEPMCGVAIEMQGGHIQSIKGDANDPLSQGYICPKATALRDLREDPERLRKPIRRTTDGWLEMEWDQAFDLVARRPHNVRTKHGRDSIGVYMGNPNVHNHGALIAGMPFHQALGISCCSRFRILIAPICLSASGLIRWRLTAALCQFRISAEE